MIGNHIKNLTKVKKGSIKQNRMSWERSDFHFLLRASRLNIDSFDRCTARIYDFIESADGPIGEYLRSNLFALYRERALLLECGDLIPDSFNGAMALETGPGYSSIYLKHYWGYDLTVVDISKSLYPELKYFGINCVQLDLIRDSIPFASNSFHYIHFGDTLAHISHNVAQVFRELHRLLAPGGRIFVTTPNFVSLQNRLKVLAGSNVQDLPRESGQSRRGHRVREYTMKEVVDLLIAAGFEIENRRYLLFNTYYQHKDVKLLTCTSPALKLYRFCLELAPSARNYFVVTAIK